jgi:diguanylate cyclase (GGDEF)-like protein
MNTTAPGETRALSLLRTSDSNGGALPGLRFFVLHSAFDILHFGFRARSNTEMQNVECGMKNEEGEAAPPGTVSCRLSGLLPTIPHRPTTHHLAWRSSRCGKIRTRMMCSPLRGARLAVIALTLVAALPALAVARRDPTFRLISRYSLMEAKEAGTQAFAIAEDRRGVLYFGNIGGVVEFDGVWWRLIKLHGDSPAFSLTSLADGRIAVGGMDEFGYLEADPAGSTRYVSLVAKLPEGQRETGECLYVFPTNDGVVFVTTKLVARWRVSGLKVIRQLDDTAPPPRCFLVNGSVWMAFPDGLSRIEGESVVPVPGGELFKGRKVRMILPWSAGRQLIAVRDEGLQLFDGKASVPFAPDASALANRFVVMTGVRLADGRYAIVTVQGGVIVMTPDGAIDEVIDSSTGLSDEDIGDALVTSDGALWLAMDSSVSRIEASSALTVVDARGGLRGTPVAVVRHHEALFVGTTSGLYKLVRPTDWLSAGNLVPRRIAFPVGDKVRSAWAFLSSGDDLLIGTGGGLLVLHGDGNPVLLEGTKEKLVYCLTQSTVDPDLVWVGLREGLGVIRRKAGAWTWQGTIDGSPGNVRTIIQESAGVVWAGTSYDGIARFDVTGEAGALPLARVKTFGQTESSVYRLAGRIVFTTDEKRILSLDQKAGKFFPDPVLGNLGNDSLPYALADDLEGNVWMNTQPVGVGRRKARGTYEFDDRILMNMPGRDIQTIYVETDGAVWFGTEAGLVRYDSRLPRRPDAPRAPLIRRVSVNGTPLTEASGKVEIAAGARRVRFETASVSYERGVQYQYRLDPIETAWSPWTSEPVTEFTNLWEGDYKLSVRTRSPRGEVSREQLWSFRVLPPWYRTTWAWTLWGVAGFGLLVGLPFARNVALRKRARLLEEQVEEKTHALSHTVEQLRVANDKLEVLSLEDPLTGIPNRRRFASSLDVEWKRARRAKRPLGFVLIDLDHFKSLNDTRGHPVGDEALRQIAGYLQRSLRRTGDHVARYGGEEFAIILPDTDAAGGVHFAEKLRAGIERLAIPNEGSPFRYVTASFGVAAVIPDDNADPAELIAAADTALYRAKRDGRNLVRAEQ